jgi:hypothetical protein
VMPWLLVFAIGLSMPVAPLTVTVLSSVSETHAGVASGVNNATARIAGLIAIAVVGALVSSSFASALDEKLPPAALDEARAQPLVTRVPSSVPPGQRGEAKVALTRASVDAFSAGVTLSALSVALGGVIAGIGVVNPRPRRASARASEATATASTP